MYLSGVPCTKDVFMKSKLLKDRLERNSDTFSGISFAKDVVTKKLLTEYRGLSTTM